MRMVLRKVKRESLKDNKCPKCGSKNIALHVQCRNKYKGLIIDIKGWSKLINSLINNGAEINIYECHKCGWKNESLCSLDL